MRSLFNNIKKVLSWYDLLFLEESYMKWAVYFLMLIRNCDKKTTSEISTRFELAPRNKKIFTRERFDADKCLAWLEQSIPIKNSKLYDKLFGFKTELILYMMATTKKKSVKKAISYFITGLRDIKIAVNGNDIKKMGLEPGPIYRQILQAVLEAKLNGQLKTRKDELIFIRSYVS